MIKYKSHILYTAVVCVILSTCLYCTNAGREKQTSITDSIDWINIIQDGLTGRNLSDHHSDFSTQIKWIDNIREAVKISQRENKPLFVTMRCLPCKQCAGFDKDVLEGGGILDHVLSKFITVRLTTMTDVDLSLFPVNDFQDLDLSWWGWFMSPKCEVYGVFGGRDHISDTTRISVPALINACERILDHHYHPDRSVWNIDGPAPDLTKTAFFPQDLSGWNSWIAGSHKETLNQVKTCLHCHQLAGVLRQPLIDNKSFNKKNEFYLWPLPENIGLVVNRDNGLLIDSVIPGSTAAEIGILRNDLLAVAGNRKLFSQADLMGVLHRGPKQKGEIPIFWLRNSQVMYGLAQVEDEWRKTNLGWRKSIAEARTGASRGFGWPLRTDSITRVKLEIPPDKMAIRPWFGKDPRGPAYESGLRPDHTIIAVNGYDGDISNRSFLVWLRINYEAGEEVTLTLKDKEGNIDSVHYILPKGHN